MKTAERRSAAPIAAPQVGVICCCRPATSDQSFCQAAQRRPTPTSTLPKTIVRVRRLVAFQGNGPLIVPTQTRPIAATSRPPSPKRARVDAEEPVLHTGASIVLSGLAAYGSDSD